MYILHKQNIGGYEKEENNAPSTSSTHDGVTTWSDWLTEQSGHWIDRLCVKFPIQTPPPHHTHTPHLSLRVVGSVWLKFPILILTPLSLLTLSSGWEVQCGLGSTFRH